MIQYENKSNENGGKPDMRTIINLLVAYGAVGIIIAAFFEAILLPVPMEVVSIPIYLANPKMALTYSILLISVSIIGSMVGYLIGRLFNRTLLARFHENDSFLKLENLYEEKAVVTLITSAFMPIPYELYVLSAGIFKVPFRKFIVGCGISRILRHLSQGILIYYGGKSLLSYAKEYTFAAAICIIVIILIIKWFKRRKLR